jgi:drug/metabolite transporter (DMT)-like permease
MSPAHKAIGYVLLATLIWSVAPVILKYGLKEIPPASFTFVRFALASLVISPLILKRPNTSIEAKDLGKMLILGAILSSHIVLVLYALTLTSVSTLTVLSSLGPLFVIFIAQQTLKEHIKARFYVGAVVATVGTLVLFIKNCNMDLNYIVGNVLLVGSLIGGAYFTIYSKRLMQKYAPVTVMSLVFPLASLFCLPLVILEVHLHGNWLSGLSNVGWFSLLYGGIFSSLFAYLFYEMGVKTLKAFQVGVMGFLDPILATAFAVILIGETIDAQFILGAALVLVGVAIATLHIPHHHRNSHKY